METGPKNECGLKFNNRIKVAQHHNLESFYQGISFMMSMQSFIFCPMSDMSFEIVMPYIFIWGLFQFFLFVCFCINSYIHLGEKRVRPSSQTQLGLDSWIQKFLPFHGLFIIIFRILEFIQCIMRTTKMRYNAAGFHSGSVVLHCSHLQETRAKQKEALLPVFSSAALMFDRLVLVVKLYRVLHIQARFVNNTSLRIIQTDLKPEHLK